MVLDCTTINAAGHLCIGGCDTTELAAAYGTPLYVMDESTIRTALRQYKASLNENYPNGGAVAFASKACCFKEMYRILQQEGCRADVVSAGEIHTALQAGFPAEHLYFHGNAKTDRDLQTALEAGIGRIVVDNESELYRLDEMAGRAGKCAEIYLRITPGVDAHTHQFIRTGQIDSKFGITLENGDALRVIGDVLKLEHVALKGLHCHIGSQIFEADPFVYTVQIMLQLMADVRDRFGVTLTELDLGGGFGIRYKESDTPLNCGDYMRTVSSAALECAEKLRLPFPFLVIEPGRSVVAPAGLTLYTVEHVKKIPDVRTYVNVDGGMADNPRYILYQAPYTLMLANRADAAAEGQVTVAGCCCESGDLIQENVWLPACERGDLIAVLATGAYNYAMASHYNRLPNPPVVFVNNGQARVVVRRESYDDLLRNDV